jgi:hypothetical protein
MTRLSNRQFPMLQAFIDNGSDHYMSITEAQTFDQRPFRSMLIQKWIAYTPGRGFHITRKGRDAWHEFHATNIIRKNPFAQLTKYFDLTQYPQRRVHEMPRVSERRTA